MLSSRYGITGADSGFFLGGGAPLRNGVNISCIRKPQVISGREGGAHPLYPPPRSAAGLT